MDTSWKAVAFAAAILATPVANAHEFICEKTVDGEAAIHVYTYPKTVTYEWTITNTHPTEPSTIDDLTDTLFPALPFTLPQTLPVGGSVSDEQMLTIESYEACVELAAAGVLSPLTTSPPSGDGVTLTNTLTVWYDGDPQTSCSAEVVCHPPEDDGEGCLTRTPGYWGTHPAVTAEFLSVESCGLELTTTEAGTEASITEDLCSVGNDHKVYGSPQEAQLVRQCAAAALNVAASAALDGSCEEALDPDRFAECCTTCGGAGAEIAASGCIEDLDAFNNSADTLLEDSSEISLCHALGLSCAAEPAACKAARGNGFVNDRAGALDAPAPARTLSSGASPLSPSSGGCAGGPAGLLALLGPAGLLALRRRR